MRRFARELGVDIADVPGTGPGGRIGQDDVKQHVKSGCPAGRRSGARVASHAPLPDFSKWGEVDVKPMSNIRRKTAEHLSVAWQAPHVTQHDKADITALEEFRKAYGARVEKAGGKLTVTAIADQDPRRGASSDIPQFASSVDMANESIVFKKYRHIGVAVDTPNGLLVPVIRDVDQKTITEIAVELAALSQKARDKKLVARRDVRRRVLDHATSAASAARRSRRSSISPKWRFSACRAAAIEPVWTTDEAQFVPREMLPLSLSYDHRVIDGADAARFLRFVAEGLEQPLTMCFESTSELRT